MKILTSEQIRRIDLETIEREGISSLELMKRAATAFYSFFIDQFPNKNWVVAIFAGIGNNGGDALVVARLLSKAGYSVKVFVVEYGNRYSEDCAHNIRRVKAEKIPFQTIMQTSEIPDLSSFDIIIDGLFGTGLSRKVDGIAADVIQCINDAQRTVVSIDVPSGLFSDKKTDFAVKATCTVTFQIPKLSLYLPGNSMFTGAVRVVPIGLNKEAIVEAETNIYLTEEEDVKMLLKPLPRFAHKGTQGHALIVGGSIGKCGSVLLASKAALRTGCGLTTAYLPQCGVSPLLTYCPEVMAIPDDKGVSHILDIQYELNPDAVGIGVGMGLLEGTQHALCDFIRKCNVPLVIDADGLNILSRHKEWLSFLRRGTVLTPHPKELCRLIGEWDNDYDKIDKTVSFAYRYGVIIVVKGAYSMVIDGERIYINSTGTPALATAGSGDVLTGMIVSLLAQGYKPLDAARIGVFLHGMTANVSSGKIHPRSFLASDIIDNIGNAYYRLEKKVDIF